MHYIYVGMYVLYLVLQASPEQLSDKAVSPTPIASAAPEPPIRSPHIAPAPAPMATAASHSPAPHPHPVVPALPKVSERPNSNHA